MSKQIEENIPARSKTTNTKFDFAEFAGNSPSFSTSISRFHWQTCELGFCIEKSHGRSNGITFVGRFSLA
jgi:hypothetical protein